MDTKEELQKEYDNLMADMALWENAVEDAGDGKYNELREKRNSLSSTWETIKDATGDAWDEVKDGFKLAIEEVRETFRKVRE